MLQLLSAIGLCKIALGIIFAFNFGGKPVYVMPLVFGGAPVVNTFFSVIQQGSYSQIGPLFTAGLILVIAGAVMVLIFAPRGQPPKAAADAKPKKEAPEQVAAAAESAPAQSAGQEQAE